MLLLLLVIILIGISEAATHSFDFDKPRYGAYCLQIAQGDGVKFQWDEYHNLKQFTSESAYNSCSFGGSTQLAVEAPNPSGVTVGPFTTSGDRFFSCSKICASNSHKVRVCVGTNCACGEGTLVTYATSASSGGGTTNSNTSGSTITVTYSNAAASNSGSSYSGSSGSSYSNTDASLAASLEQDFALTLVMMINVLFW